MYHFRRSAFLWIYQNEEKLDMFCCNWLLPIQPASFSTSDVLVSCGSSEWAWHVLPFPRSTPWYSASWLVVPPLISNNYKVWHYLWFHSGTLCILQAWYWHHFKLKCEVSNSLLVPRYSVRWSLAPLPPHQKHRCREQSVQLTCGGRPSLSIRPKDVHNADLSVH